MRKGEDVSQLRCSVVGLGKLGACMAAAIASRGHDVIGVDVSPATVDLVASGRAPVVEPGLQGLMTAHRERIRATRSFDEAVAESDITFVVVPTPSAPAGGFSTEHVAAAFRSLGEALARKTAYHLVVLTSTVLPGSTRYALVPILEGASRKRVGRDIGLCYNPEFIALGSVIRDFLAPDLVLIGEHDARSGEMLERAYAGIVTNAAPVRRMSLENAELAKIALNSYVTMKITFANTLADLCERLPGGDVDAVTGALGLDTRIGARYLTGAVGYGGPCFPRDDKALAHFARTIGAMPELPEVTDQLNRRVLAALVDRVRAKVRGESIVAVLGLAYKPGTPVTEASAGSEIARALGAAGVRVLTYDPLAYDEATSRPLEDCLAQADVIVVATPDPLFKDMTPDRWRRLKRGATVIDCWRILDPAVIAGAGATYAPIGKGGVDAARRLGEILS